MLPRDATIQPAEVYGNDIYTTSFGTEIITEKLHARYGQKYVDYREAWAKADEQILPDFPLNLIFDLIDGCNLACPQCLRAVDLIKGYEGLLNNRSQLPYELVVAALDEGYQYGLPSANLGGSGECTLHPRFLDICKAIMEHDVMELRVITNGLRLNETTAEALIDMQVPFVSVSIDAFSPETYGISRGKPHRYQSVVENTLKFLELRQRNNSVFPLLRVTFVNQPGNTHELNDFLDFWTRRVDMVDVQSYIDPRATNFSDDFDCFEPWQRMSIWADRHITPCCGFPGIVYDVGKFGELKLHEIWHSEQMDKFRQMVSSRKYELPCLKCNGTRDPNM